MTDYVIDFNLDGNMLCTAIKCKHLYSFVFLSVNKQSLTLATLFLSSTFTGCLMTMYKTLKNCYQNCHVFNVQLEVGAKREVQSGLSKMLALILENPSCPSLGMLQCTLSVDMRDIPDLQNMNEISISYPAPSHSPVG